MLILEFSYSENIAIEDQSFSQFVRLTAEEYCLPESGGRSLQQTLGKFLPHYT
jgi:hypothetical protein